jgi:2',3'-cyclic-nucleotide 2'-phosphodiesterase (5'-nucleotidase family)
MKPPKYSQNIISMSARFISLFLIIAILVSCKSQKETVAEVKDNSLITLKFVQLNDVYEIAPLSGGKYGGMARVAHVTDSIRKSHPNTYLVCAGDILNPSLLGTIKYEGDRIRGRQMIEVMNAMDFSLVTFGNHEFDLDRSDLQKRLDESNFQWVSSNVLEVKEGGNTPFSMTRDIGNIQIPDVYTLTVSDKDGTTVNLGFFSVTLDSNPRDYVYYGDIYSEAEKAYTQLKANSEVIIGLTHLKVEDDKKLAEKFNDIALIMGGHEHNNMRYEVGNTVVAKADANAKTIYIHTLTYNKISGETTVDSVLFPIDEKTPSDPEVEAIVKKWNKILDAKIMEVISDPYEVIYYADPPLDGTDSANRGIQTNMGDILTEAMSYSYGNEVDASLLNGGSIRLDDMLEGDVTSIDVFRVLPFGGSIIKVDITGDLLKEVLDFGKSESGTGAYLQRHNISESPDGGWLVKGEPLEGGKRYYTVAFSDFLLKGYDIPFLTPENPGVLKVYTPSKNELANDIRKAVILYLKSIK